MKLNKYRNVKKDGYSSKREAKRAQDLKMLQGAGIISDLKEQVKYEIIPKQDGERAAHYVADFEYTENGKKITEDSKGVRTREYVLKRKLMLRVHGIRIVEV